MKRLMLFFVVIALQLADAQLAQAQTFSVKGVLRDPLGRTVDDGSYKLTLKLYDAAENGSELFSEIHGNVPVQHGVFSVELGSVESMAGVSFLNTLWLGITVESENEMTPRIKLTPSPYSLGVIGSENRFPSTGNVGIGVTATQNKLDVEGNAAIGAGYSGNVAGPANGLIVEGNVGIGTVIPGEPLDVNGNIKVNGALIFSDNTSISSASLSGSASSLANPSNAIIAADSDEDGSGQIEFRTGATTRVRIKNSGIPLTIENAGETGLQINDTASGQSWQAGVNERGFFLYDTAHRFVVGPGGAVGIGTTDATAQISNAKLRVSGNGHVVVDNDFGFVSVNSAGNGWGAGIDTETDDALAFYAGGAQRARITNNGTFETIGGNINTGTGTLFGYSAELRRSGGTLNTPDVYGQGTLVLGGAGGGGGSVVTSAKIGVGTSSPGWPVHVANNASGRTQVMAIENTSGNVGDGASLIFLANGGSNGTGGIGSVITNASPFSADVRVSTISGGNWRNDVLTVTGNGRVGVGEGNTAPDATLDVAGTVKMMGSYQDRNKQQDYNESTDGFVTAYCSAGANNHVRASGIVSDITVQRIDTRDNNWDTTLSIMFPVPKGATWRVESNETCVVRFMPLGY